MKKHLTTLGILLLPLISSLLAVMHSIHNSKPYLISPGAFSKLSKYVPRIQLCLKYSQIDARMSHTKRYGADKKKRIKDEKKLRQRTLRKLEENHISSSWNENNRYRFMSQRNKKYCTNRCRSFIFLSSTHRGIISVILSLDMEKIL